MQTLKKIVDFYLDASIHLAFSCFSLVQITFLSFHILENKALSFFAFFGTIVGYNFVKYDALARAKKAQMRKELKAIFILSVASFIAVGFCFFQLERMTQFVSILVLFLTLLYTLPFFPDKKNARNWAGVKIYIVALCWVVVTVVLPLLNANFPFDLYTYCYVIQRFILVFILVLIFEIIDLSKDDPQLKTVPQQIGVKRTKSLGYVLMLVFFGLEFLNSNYNDNFQLLPLIFEIGIAITIVLFLAFGNEKRSKYYTSFWVEAIPIIWFLLLMLFQ
jgi:hypothetical protein